MKPCACPSGLGRETLTKCACSQRYHSDFFFFSFLKGTVHRAPGDYRRVTIGGTMVSRPRAQTKNLPLRHSLVVQLASSVTSLCLSYIICKIGGRYTVDPVVPAPSLPQIPLLSCWSVTRRWHSPISPLWALPWLRKMVSPKVTPPSTCSPHPMTEQKSV